MLFQLTGRAGLRRGPRHLLRRFDSLGLGWAAGTGLIYFAAAWLSLQFAAPQGVSPFWPAAGVAVGGLLSSSGPRLPVAAAVAAASFLANWFDGRAAPVSIAFALGNMGEALTVAAFAGRWINQPLELDRLKSVLALFAAVALGTVTWEAANAAVLSLTSPGIAEFSRVWGLLVWANLTGIITVAPVVMGLAAAARKPPPSRLIVEGSAVLIIHALASAYAFGLLPFEFARWMQIAPLASQLPILLWLAVRCGPLFAAAGSLVLGIAIFRSFSVHNYYFAKPGFPESDQLFSMHFAMLAVSFAALTIAALIAERRNAEIMARRSEARLKLSRDAGNF